MNVEVDASVMAIVGAGMPMWVLAPFAVLLLAARLFRAQRYWVRLRRRGSRRPRG